MLASQERMVVPGIWYGPARAATVAAPTFVVNVVMMLIDDNFERESASWSGKIHWCNGIWAPASAPPVCRPVGLGIIGAHVRTGRPV